MESGLIILKQGNTSPVIGIGCCTKGQQISVTVDWARHQTKVLGYESLYLVSICLVIHYV